MDALNVILLTVLIGVLFLASLIYQVNIKLEEENDLHIREIKALNDFIKACEKQLKKK